MANELKPFSVKPLVWRHSIIGEFTPLELNAWSSDSAFQSEAYRIVESPSGRYDLHRGAYAICENLDAAKAAAQADYERRILSAIEPAPAPIPTIPGHYGSYTPVTLSGHTAPMNEADLAAAVCEVNERNSRAIHKAQEVQEIGDPEEPPPAYDDGWHPIETAPKDGTRILAVESFQREDEDGRLYPEDAAVVRWVTSRHDGHSGWSGYGLFLASFEPTHWRPLHAPPKGEAP